MCLGVGVSGFFFKASATTEIYTYRHTLSLHDALPISVLDDLRRQFEDRNTRTAELARQLPQNAERSINARFDIARSTSLYAVLAVAAIGLLTAWMLYRSITGPLAAFTSFVEREIGRASGRERVCPYV